MWVPRETKELIMKGQFEKKKEFWELKNIVENGIKCLKAEMEELCHKEENLKEIEIMSAKQKIDEEDASYCC